MQKEPIFTSNAPAAIGPYSQAVRAGNFVFLSGQIAIDPKTNTVVTAGIIEETQQVFKNMEAITEAAGGSLQNVIKLTIFLTDLSNFAAVNSVMESYFQQPYPARSTIEVSALPKGVSVEIEAVLLLSK